MAMRTWVAADTHKFLGTVVDNGHCARHVQVVAGVPHSSTWRRGAHVRGGNIPRGTIIATFDRNGRYANATNGDSHICIFLEERPDGLRVVDQWQNRKPIPGVAERTIGWKGDVGPACDDGDRYYVCETDDA